MGHVPRSLIAQSDLINTFGIHSILNYVIDDCNVGEYGHIQGCIYKYFTISHNIAKYLIIKYITKYNKYRFLIP